MSRGPGRIERIIFEAMHDHPSEVYTVAKLAALAYPDVEPDVVPYHGMYWRMHPVYPKHCRSAILRAARTAVPRAGWDVMKAEAPGGPPVYFNPYDLRSYALARRLAWYGNFHRPESDLDSENHSHDRELLVAGTGAWWRHVEVRKLRRDGKIGEAEAIEAALEREVAALMGAFRR
jgi:hypothetical protein